MSNKWLYLCRGWVCFVVISAYDRSFEYYMELDNLINVLKLELLEEW